MAFWVDGLAKRQARKSSEKSSNNSFEADRNEELLSKFKIETLEKRREKLCMDFGRKSLIHSFHKIRSPPTSTTKQLPRMVAVPVYKFQPVRCAHQRLAKSFMPIFVKMCNES